MNGQAYLNKIKNQAPEQRDMIEQKVEGKKERIRRTGRVTEPGQRHHEQF